MVDYSTERIGYYSVINGVLEKALFKTLNIDAVKKINHDGISVDCSHQVPITHNKESVEHLLKYLQNKQLLPGTPGTKEFWIVSQARSLCNLLVVDYKGRVSNRFEFYKIDDNTTIIKDIARDEENAENSEGNLTKPGQVLQKLMALLPYGGAERRFGMYPLFVVVKHKFVFSTGVVINLFVSKQIHSILRNCDDIIPVDLRLNVYYSMAIASVVEKYMWSQILLSYLGGGLSQILAVSLEDYHANKLIVVDDKTVLCEAAALRAFMELLISFLEKLALLRCDGQLKKAPKIMHTQDILLSTDPEKWIKIFDACETYVNVKFGYIEPEEVDHELVVLGSCKKPIINYPNHYYNADFVTLENFSNGTYSDLLQEPKWIKFYGTAEEFEMVQRRTPEEQLAKLIFVKEDS